MGSRFMRVMGYSWFFLACFVASVYLTFPLDVLKPRIVEEMNKRLNAGRNPGAYGKPGRVTVDRISMWRLTGVELSDVVIHDVTTDPDPPPPWVLDSVKVRVGILGLLRKQLAITFDVAAYEGTVVGDILLVGEGFRQPKSVDVVADGLQWARTAYIQQKWKVPGEGGLGGEVHLQLGKEIKEAAGDIKLRGEGLAVGPGELSIPAFGTLTIPRVDLGKLQGDIKVAESKTTGPPITLTGTDVQGALDVPLTLRMPFENSQLNGTMALKLSEPFLKANPRFGTVFDLTPIFKNARGDDAVFRFKVKDTVRRPDVKADRGAKINVKG